MNEPCKRDEIMQGPRRDFQHRLISEKEFERKIESANSVCVRCTNPTCIYQEEA